MAETIRWDNASTRFVVGIDERALSAQESFDGEAHLDDVKDVTLSSLARALRMQLLAQTDSGPSNIFGACATDHEPIFARGSLWIWSSEATRLQKFWHHKKPPLAIYLTTDDKFVFFMTAGLGLHVTIDELRHLLAPALLQRRAKLLNVVLMQDEPKEQYWSFWLDVETRGRTIGDIYNICYEATLAIQFPDIDWMTPTITMSLLRAGGAQSLIGQRESQWLEVKKMAYDFDRDKGSRIEFAQDIGRFANSEEGGILLLGVEEKNEVIKSLRPLPVRPRRIKSYRDTLNRHIYPLVSGLQLEAIPVGGGEILAILVPPQQEERKPFLVKGAIAAKKYEGSFISIVQRRGDSSVTTSAEEIHALIAIGKAVLRHGLPRSSAESID